jgi:hypothetical protein
MDASEYLRQKKAAQINYIHRQATQDAGFRTYILGKAANKTFVSMNTNPAALHTTNCCPTRTGYAGSYTTPVKPAPCESEILCSQTTYTTPYISTPCCAITYAPSTSYVRAEACACSQATPQHAKSLSAVVANKERGLCCPTVIAP